MDITLSLYAVGLVGIIMILASLSKTYIDSKWTPLIVLVLSLLAAFFLVPSGIDAAHTALTGIVMALSGMGLYSGAKSTAGVVSGSSAA